ncbi:hypothetical protein B0J18DRAFT_484795 [Chaetomium sp. MPI-SDFR-AT-0129]|nr:hypothetical protein B0J18DRAFT_484795 [Chaetomium sp. MPI-SDFR-AT-0129]
MKAYSETIKDRNAFNKGRPNDQDLNNIPKLPAANKWSREQLFAARLVIRSKRPKKELNHLLPSLQGHVKDLAAAHKCKSIQDFVDGFEQQGVRPSMSETEVAAEFGQGVASCWAALAAFRDVGGGGTTGTVGLDGGHEDDAEEDEAEEDDRGNRKRHRSHDSDTSTHRHPKRIQTRSMTRNSKHRTKSQTSDSSLNQSSSSPSEPSHGSSPGHIDLSHDDDDAPEMATVWSALNLFRYILQSSPRQRTMTAGNKPKVLVEVSAASRQLSGQTAAGGSIRATADGEFVLRHLNHQDVYEPTNCRPALIEAKKKFQNLQDGKPSVTDELLGQMTSKRFPCGSINKS